MYEGKLEAATCAAVVGWIWDRNNPNHTIFVDVWIDGRIVCTAAANDYRVDLETKGIGHGRYGFNLTLPDWISASPPHNLRVSVLGLGPDVPGWAARISKRSPTSFEERVPSAKITTVFYHHHIKPVLPKQSKVKALVGHNNWLFLANDSNRVLEQLKGRMPPTQKQLDEYRLLAGRRLQRFHDLNIPYVMFIAPTKELVYKDYLPEGICVDEASYPPNLLGSAMIQEGLHVESLLSALRSARSLNDVYFKTDTHWNQIGGLIAYEEILKAISAKMPGMLGPVRKDFLFAPLANFRGDLADKGKVIAIPGDDKLVSVADDEYDPELFSEVTPTVSGYVAYSQKIIPPEHLQISQGSRETSLFESQASSGPKILVFHDSFMLNVMPYLSNHFARSAYLWRPHLCYEAIERERPDIVISVVLDRFMRATPNE